MSPICQQFDAVVYKRMVSSYVPVYHRPVARAVVTGLLCFHLHLSAYVQGVRIVLSAVLLPTALDNGHGYNVAIYWSQSISDTN